MNDDSQKEQEIENTDPIYYELLKTRDYFMENPIKYIICSLIFIGVIAILVETGIILY